MIAAVRTTAFIVVLLVVASFSVSIIHNYTRVQERMQSLTTETDSAMWLVASLCRAITSRGLAP